MSSLLSISIKGKDGTYKNYTISVQDETNEYGQNVAMFIEQSKEEREAKAKRTYVGNGRVVWTDGKINVADKKEPAQSEQTTVTEQKDEDDLPF